MPAIALKLALGEMSSLLLGSMKVAPAAAQAKGYAFKRPTLESALAGV